VCVRVPPLAAQTWWRRTWRRRCAWCSRAASRRTPWRTRSRSGWSRRRARTRHASALRASQTSRHASLTPGACAATQQLGKGSPALAAFKAAFSGATLSRGTVVTLSAARGGKLTAVVAGAAKAPIASPELCRALFDIYLGKDPVAPAAKEALGVALAARLSA
jgi:hypothetical protein